jgi:HK97 family phage major capsid protein
MASTTEVQAADPQAMTRHELQAEIKSAEEKMDALSRIGGNDLKGLSDGQVVMLKDLNDRHASLKAAFDKKIDTVALKAQVDSAINSHSTVRRPPLGLQHQGDTAGNGDVKGRVDSGESELEKFVHKGPWKSLGHLGHELRKAGRDPGRVMHGTLGEWNQGVTRFDSAIKGMSDDTKAISGMSEFADPDGAAFVPVEMSQQVWQRAMGIPNLLSMVDQTPVSGNGYSMTAWQDQSVSGNIVFGGAQAYWTNEADQLTKSQPTARKITWKLNKLAVLMYATDELLADTIALDARLAQVAGYAFAFKLNDAIINGTGNGQPLGLLNSGAKITATAVSGQGANTLIAKNADDMYVRRAPGATDWVWLHNITCEPQFAQFNYPLLGNTSSVAATWAYVPAGLSGGPATIKGENLMETQHCKALGTEGDFILWSPSSYGVIVKSTGIAQAVSMHLRFDYDEMAFRWTYRIDGRPFWDQPYTPVNGTTRSPIVTLSSTRT